MRLQEDEWSPDLQYRLLETVLRTNSFSAAAMLARVWCGQAVSGRQLNRMSVEMGGELVQTRDTHTDDVVHHRKGAKGLGPKHAMVAVFVDGGRLQLRDERWGDPEADASRPFWREDKIARLQTMTDVCHSNDPCPEPPGCFLDSQLLTTLVLAEADTPKPLKNQAEIDKALKSLDRALNDEPPGNATTRWQPQPLQRSCVATTEPLEQFRWMVQAEAHRRHFFTARKRAFIADGAHGNWSLRDRHFPDFVPILDFLHAASYLHEAAKALSPTDRLATTRHADAAHWVRELWHGRCDAVTTSLRQRLVDRGHKNPASLDETDPLRPVADAIRYLTNHADKVDYPRYRKEGLPCTSSLMESQIKEFNKRVKGTEKFWNKSAAEAMLQLQCWALQDDGPNLKNYVDSRPGNPFRKRSDDPEKIPKLNA